MLAGDGARVQAIAGEMVSSLQASRALSERSVLWIGHSAPAGISCRPAAKALNTLGGEFRIVVFDAWSGFNPDAFCAVTGTLVGGGLLICLTPSLQDWNTDADYRRMVPYGYSVETTSSFFLARVANGFLHGDVFRVWNDVAQCWYPHPGSLMSAAAPALERNEGSFPQTGFAVTQQDALVSRMAALPFPSLSLPSPFVSVITADRGRGKTALLGRVAAHWAGSVPLRIAVTAPVPAAAQPLFSWLQKEWVQTGQGTVFKCEIKTSTPDQDIHPTPFFPECRLPCAKGGESWIRFIAPDALLQDAHEFDVVLVDEAAMLPIAILQHLILRFPRIVLASTVHGYEGSGRGMVVKLFPWLDRHRPGWLSFQMSAPIRWADNDPLERWLGDVFCLNDEWPAITDTTAVWSVRKLTGKHLHETPSLLRDVFALLVSAHYRTTPSDLRDVLDGPNLALWALFVGERVAGVCLLAWEGSFTDKPLCDAIMAGARRPRGHLLPQVMAFHCHAPELLEVRCARIVRIAVTPDLQGKGWGTRLLGAVEAALNDSGVDILGSSFALELPVLRFWQRHGLQVLRVGATRESASGLPSCLVAKPLAGASASVIHCLQELHAQFGCEAPRTLPAPLFVSDLGLMTQNTGSNDAATEARLRARIARFISGALPFESALGALWRAWPGVDTVESIFAAQESAAEARRFVRALNDLVEGQGSLVTFATQTGVSGRDEAIRLIRQMFAQLENGDASFMHA